VFLVCLGWFRLVLYFAAALFDSLVAAPYLGSNILSVFTTLIHFLFDLCYVAQGKGMRDHESFDRLVSASNPALQTVRFASRGFRRKKV
jgi:hypothetical protein